MFLTRAERRRRRWRRRATIFLAVLLALIAWAAAQNPRGEGQHRHPGRGAASHHTASRHQRRNRTYRASPAAKTQGTLAWVNYHGISLPVSPQAGPLHTRNGLAWGFTDSRQGALLAAVNIAVRTAAQWGPHIYLPTIRRQVTGPDARALLQVDDRDYAALRAAAHVKAGEPAGRGYAAEIAYRFLGYSPADITVEVVSEGPGSGASTVMVATRIQAVWHRGDWRVVAPSGGDWRNSASPVSSLTGYTTFPNGG